MKYDILCSESLDNLIEYVNAALQNGWQCQGGVGILTDRKSTRLNSSHPTTSRMPSSA